MTAKRAQVKNKVPQASLLYLLRGEESTGLETYHVVLVNRITLPLLKAALKTGALNVLDYGESVASGFGPAIPAQVKTALEARYGVDIIEE